MHYNYKLSIITVVYNSKNQIEKTIKSVLANKNKNIEYILIDGKSTDGTIDIVKKYKHIIDIILIENDQGIYDAMNKGINLSSGEYIYFLNSGDHLVTKGFQDAIKLIEDSSIFDMCMFSRLTCEGIKSSFNQKLDELGIKYMPNHQSIFVKKSFLKIFDLQYKIAADFKSYLCILNNNPTICISSHVIVYYDILKSNMTQLQRQKYRIKNCKEKMMIINDICTLKYFIQSYIYYFSHLCYYKFKLLIYEKIYCRS